MSNTYQGIAEKRIFITGSSNGVGFSMAKALLSNGAKVMVTGSSQVTLDQAMLKLHSIGGELLGSVLDVRNAQSIQNAVTLMKEKWGGIDILINNAGIGMKTINPLFLTTTLPFWEIHNENQFKNILDTNITGYFLTALAVITVFLNQPNKGRIINIGISFAAMKRKGFAPYGASRAGSESLSHIMAQDLEGTGITVNILAPGGPTKTNQIPQDTPKTIEEKLLSTDIMNDATLFLCSDNSKGLNDVRIDAIDFDYKNYSTGPYDKL